MPTLSRRSERVAPATAAAYARDIVQSARARRCSRQRRGGEGDKARSSPSCAQPARVRLPSPPPPPPLVPASATTTTASALVRLAACASTSDMDNSDGGGGGGERCDVVGDDEAVREDVCEVVLSPTRSDAGKDATVDDDDDDGDDEGDGRGARPRCRVLRVRRVHAAVAQANFLLCL